MSSLLPIREWGFPVGDFFLSAGPCSAETEDQLFGTARALVGAGIGLFRAGVWKPRTFPGSFEGVGERGLAWLSRIRQELHLPVAVEVGSPDHVELALRHGIDAVWIGARTTPNPFAVQAIADSLRGCDLPVLVKNPISPDLDLWLGAIERLSNAGLTKIGAVHRGFSSPRRGLYRYSPHWQIPIEIKRLLPELPLLCDPSHISGRSDLVFTVAQEALDLLFDGLMVEVHIAPEQAWSDKDQQITPSEFQELVRRLQPRSEDVDDDDLHLRIKELRRVVDDLDDHLLKTLGQRMDVVRRLGALKRQHRVSTLQPRRWREIVESRVAAGREERLSEEFVLQLFQAIHEEAIRHQEHDAQENSTPSGPL